MTRLVLVSNRVGDREGAQRPGGLVSAILDSGRAGDCLWFGWSGEIITGYDDTETRVSTDGGMTFATYAMTQQEYDEYYLGYANTVLWPTFHSRPDLALYDGAHAATYRSVNKGIAASIAALLKSDDVIWIHDYHMIPLAFELRVIGVENRLGFFLHIPFPRPGDFQTVPEHSLLYEYLCAYDLVGFQTERDLKNFTQYGSTAHSARSSSHAAGHSMNLVPKTGVFPVGVDITSLTDKEPGHASIDDPDGLLLPNGSVDIIGADRLDLFKGIPERIRAYSAYLREMRAPHDEPHFVQIAVPTRTALQSSKSLRSKVDILAADVNLEFGHEKWLPLHCVFEPIPRRTLFNLFSRSRVGLVTPLADGMNLVAKEYVAAQVDEDPGVLILSKFAGASEDLKAALLVDPFDVREVAAALNAALSMPHSERLERHGELKRRVLERSASAWRTRFLDDLLSVCRPEPRLDGRMRGVARETIEVTSDLPTHELIAINEGGKEMRESNDNLVLSLQAGNW